MQISKSDREYLDALDTRSLALIIYSQTYNGKSRFINELLNEPFLPETPVDNQNDLVQIVGITIEVRLRIRKTTRIEYHYLESSNTWYYFEYN